MKKLINKAKKFLGSALLASALAIPSFAGDGPKEDGGILGEWAMVGFGAELYGAPTYHVDVPGKCVPVFPRDGWIKHRTPTDGTLETSFNLNIELFSIFDASVKYTNPSKVEGPYETYWGGYGVGRIACIGEVSVKDKPWSYELTLQTPIIPLGDKEGLRVFVSQVSSEFEANYKSGYHMWNVPFYEVEEEFKIGNFKRTGTRAGIKLLMDQRDWITSVNIFVQKNSLDSKFTEKGRDFKFDDGGIVGGVALEILF
jgi:hypothetical protein